MVHMEGNSWDSLCTVEVNSILKGDRYTQPMGKITLIKNNLISLGA